MVYLLWGFKGLLSAEQQCCTPVALQPHLKALGKSICVAMEHGVQWSVSAWRRSLRCSPFWHCTPGHLQLKAFMCFCCVAFLPDFGLASGGSASTCQSEHAHAAAVFDKRPLMRMQLLQLLG